MSDSRRRHLVAILEEYGVSVHGFDGLRSDTYEKQIAARSLTELEGFYRTLMEAYGSYEEKQKLCPVWNRGGKCGDKLPDIKMLCNIKERIRLEGRLADMSGHLKAFTAVAESLTGLPVAERAVVLQGMQALIAAELMRLTIEGGKVLDHLPAVDRAIRAVSAQARGENMEARVRLAEKSLELKREQLEFQKEGRAKAESEADDRRRRKAEAEERQHKKKAAAAAAYDPVAEKAKIRAMIDKMYKLPPRDPVTGQREAGPQPVTESKAETGDKRRDAKDAEGKNDEAQMTNGTESVQDSAAGQQVSSVQSETDRANKTDKSTEEQPGKLATGKSPEPADKNACPTAAVPVVESLEEQQRRLRLEREKNEQSVLRKIAIFQREGKALGYDPYA